MRKHFLILMLTALLPLVGWAAAPAVKTAPAAKTLTYNGAAQALVTAGVVADDAPAGTAIYYAVVADGDAAPVWVDGAGNPFKSDLPTGTLANGYDVYYLTRLGTENSEVSAKIDVTIAKADLLVKAVSETTYFGSATTKLQVVFDGFQGADNEADLFAFKTKPSIAAGATTVGPHVQTPSGGDALDNYNYVYVGGTLTIEKARVQIVPNDINAKYGSANAAKTSFSNTQAAPDFKIKLQNGYDGQGNPTYAAAADPDGTYLTIASAAYKNVTLTRANTSTAVGNYVITAAGGELKDANTNRDYQLTYGTGTFTIQTANVTITPNNNAKVYGETDPQLTFTATYTGGVEEATLTDAAKSQISVSRAEGDDVATYNITASGPATFEGYVFNYAEPAKFMITKRAVTITALPQVLYTGNTAADLNKEAVTFANLKEGDEILLDWSFAAGGNVDGGTGALQMIDGNNNFEDAAGAIVIAVKAGEEYPNYNITLNAGDLRIINLAKALVLTDTDAALIDKLAVANNTPKTLAFGSRTLKAETWNVLVLPFATSVKDISEAFGYAVVDILDETASDGNVHLKLHMGAIPANTPFIVKNYQDVDLNTVVIAGTPTIKYEVGAEYIDANGNVFIADAAGNKFIGTYKTTEVYGSNIQYMTGKGIFKDAGAYTADNKLSLKPLRAYLQTVAQNNAGAAPIIYIEEPDGSTTAIETVNAVKVANGNDAIYNLAGQKVGADYKGIVIKNGKRFVQK